MLVPDEYYNARELHEEVFKPLGAKLYLDTHTGLLRLTTKNDNIMISSDLAKVLDFSQNTFEAEKMLLRNGLTRSSKKNTADEPHRLAVYIHLAELSTSENLTNGQPSTLLRSIPVPKTKNGLPGELYHFKSCNIKGLRQVLFRS